SMTPGSSIDVITQFKNQEIEEATGFFGQRSINIPSNNLDFDISGLDDLVNGLYLTEPQLVLNTVSTLGASLSMKLDLDGVNSKGNITSLNATNQQIAAADDPNTPKHNSIK